MTPTDSIDCSSTSVEESPKAVPALWRPLKVLHVINVETSNYFLNNLVDYMPKGGVQFTVVTFGAEGSFVEDLRRRGVTAYALNARQRSSYPRAARELWKIIRQNKIDIIHTHLFDTTVIGLITAKLHGRPVVVTRHHSISLYVNPSWIKRTGYLLIEKFINARADYIIAPSRFVGEILTLREGVSPAKVSVLPYGQTSERFASISGAMVEEVRDELGMRQCRSLVFVARLHDRKGHRDLFAALDNLLRKGLQLKLYLVGEGPDRANLEALARSLGIERNINFLGWRKDALAIIAAGDMVIHPSLEETLPSAVIEALMLERPIVACDVGGVRDILGDSEYGRIVPPGDVLSLTDAIEQTVKNLEQAQAQARRGREYLLDYMAADRVADGYLRCYLKVMENAS
jgi:glycosyltransferase involved in cell wall biosynthesis